LLKEQSVSLFNILLIRSLLSPKTTLDLEQQALTTTTRENILQTGSKKNAVNKKAA